MKELVQYIQEKLQINKDNKIKDNQISDKIYQELSKPEYKIKFKMKSDSDINDYIHLIESDKLKFYEDNLKECFPQYKEYSKYKIFKLAVWNNGVLRFTKNPEFSQGEIIYYNNNTDFVYYILVDNDEANVCGFERRYYGQENLIGNIYKFKL